MIVTSIDVSLVLSQQISLLQKCRPTLASAAFLSNRNACAESALQQFTHSGLLSAGRRPVLISAGVCLSELLRLPICTAGKHWYGSYHQFASDHGRWSPEECHGAPHAFTRHSHTTNHESSAPLWPVGGRVLGYTARRVLPLCTCVLTAARLAMIQSAPKQTSRCTRQQRPLTVAHCVGMAALIVSLPRFSIGA